MDGARNVKLFLIVPSVSMASSYELIDVRREDCVDPLKMGPSTDPPEGMRALLDTRPPSWVEDDRS